MFVLDDIPIFPFSNFYTPQITLIKVWLHSEDADLHSRAATLLSSYITYCEKTNNTLFKEKFKALEALSFYLCGEKAEAFHLLERLLPITSSRGLMRIFLDAGPKMGTLLSAYLTQNGRNEFLEKILDAFPAVPETISFTRRELDVLPLLSLPNKEIAEQLFIAEKTVKRHSNSIFKKLRVKNRREALRKAEELMLV